MMLGLSTAACTSETAGESAPPSAPAGLTEALRFLPAEVTSFRFSDAAGLRKAAGLGAVTGKDAQDPEKYRTYTQFAAQAGLGTSVDAYGPTAAEGLGFNSFDLQWEVQVDARPQVQTPLTVLRIRDGLDLASVEKKLTDLGLTKSAAPQGMPAGAVRFEADLSKLTNASSARLLIGGATLLPQQHLIQVGREPLAPAASDRSQESTSGSLLQGLPSLTLLVNTGGDACASAAASSGPPISAEQLRQQLEKYADLKQITAAAVGIGSPTDAQIRVRYASAADAEADVKARTALMTANSDTTRKPLSELFTGSAAVSGDTITYRLSGPRTSRFLTSAVSRQQDTFWAWCPG